MDESRSLSSEDKELLLKFLKEAPEPTLALKKAYKKVVAIYQVEESGRTIYTIGTNMLRKPKKMLKK